MYDLEEPEETHNLSDDHESLPELAPLDVTTIFVSRIWFNLNMTSFRMDMNLCSPETVLWMTSLSLWRLDGVLSLRVFALPALPGVDAISENPAAHEQWIHRIYNQVWT